MNQDYISYLRILRTLEPSPDFAKKSRKILLASIESSRHTPWFSFPRLAFAGLFSFLVLAGALTLLFPFGGGVKPIAVASLNQEALREELNTLSINVTLNRIAYDYDESVNKTVESALSEIGRDDVSHLSSSLIESERTALESVETPEEDKIETLLTQITQ